MSLSKIDICNMALARCGVTTEIHALEFSGSEAVPNEARLCKLYWELAFRAEARCHDWKCLTDQKDISAALSTTPVWDYAYAYQLPADFIRLLRVEDTTARYAIRGRKLYCDAIDVKIEYIRYTEDTDLLDPLFIEALVLRMAMHLSPALSGENAAAIAKDLLQLHEMITLPQATFVDSTEQSTVTIDSETWRDSRL